jgi:hypothetical protein
VLSPCAHAPSFHAALPSKGHLKRLTKGAISLLSLSKERGRGARSSKRGVVLFSRSAVEVPPTTRKKTLWVLPKYVQGHNLGLIPNSLCIRNVPASARLPAAGVVLVKLGLGGGAMAGLVNGVYTNL